MVQLQCIYLCGWQTIETPVKRGTECYWQVLASVFRKVAAVLRCGSMQVGELKCMLKKQLAKPHDL